MAVNANTLINFGSAAPSGLRLLDRQVFTANGTWTKPADTAGNVLSGIGKIVKIRAIGGGGGGYSYNTNYYTSFGSTGGGGGGCDDQNYDISQITGTVTVTVGSNGTGADVQNSTTPTNGGNSSFGTYAVAGGGTAGKIIGVNSGNYIAAEQAMVAATCAFVRGGFGSTYGGFPTSTQGGFSGGGKTTTYGNGGAPASNGVAGIVEVEVWG